jgi:CheY-like chemotaxis protein
MLLALILCVWLHIKKSCSVNHSRVLLAEDNELNQKVTLAMLKRLGYKADTALNGIEVLRALEYRQYDLILMNIGMPLLDGIEATVEIRKRWQNGPRIVALTARVLPEIKEKCIEAGMDDYIAKPVQMRELAEALKRCSLEPERRTARIGAWGPDSHSGALVAPIQATMSFLSYLKNHF